MKTISQAVSEYIKSKPFLSSALSDGIINFTSLSRKIKPDIQELLRKKVKITIHDPKALENTRKIFGNKINYSRSVGDALSKSQCVILMTQWKQYEKLGNNEFKRMTKKIVIDGRRMLSGKQLDVDYFAIGLGKEK